MPQVRSCTMALAWSNPWTCRPLHEAAHKYATASLHQFGMPAAQLQEKSRASLLWAQFTRRTANLEAACLICQCSLPSLIIGNCCTSWFEAANRVAACPTAWPEQHKSLASSSTLVASPEAVAPTAHCPPQRWPCRRATRRRRRGWRGWAQRHKTHSQWRSPRKHPCHRRPPLRQMQ